MKHYFLETPSILLNFQELYYEILYQIYGSRPLRVLGDTILWVSFLPWLYQRTVCVGEGREWKECSYTFYTIFPIFFYHKPHFIKKN